MTSLSDGAVTQFAVLDALLAGVYASGMTVRDALGHGDLGIGCCDRLGGEVVIVDGEAFECTVDGPPSPMTDAAILPFVDVAAFPVTDSAEVRDLDLEGVTAAVEGRLLSRNLFHAVRLDGVMATARIRATPRQQHPFPPLDKVTSEQVETVLARRAGTLVGYWAPTIYQGIAVAGLHLHFLADDRLAGGHVLDLTVERGHLRLVAYARFDLHLPVDDLFLRTELTHDRDHRIVAVEGGVDAR
ncbi:acetolactate decarboxylase [Pseudoclavibacter endophyticus]|uniref:Alpha-acetolactate decarboxylase n=1 Tax=Pseudoclavibacter endophyticus TaxID=1778590 RepID=A0A6H9WUW9_9MICO|nr:acetolactate decarboxylase [Pseudoclavibacter endophyticus]KAB1649990.1 acetolactate decarboxylase [Pseudoclavibacter endophyticus]